MTLYRCTASGVQPSGRPWSLRIYHTSSSTNATVETDWLAQFTSFWTDGTHGVQTLFPTGTIFQHSKVEQMAVVTVGGVDKLRSVGQAFDNVTHAGTSANAALPDQNVVLVSMRSATPGREGRGRYHLPAPDETLVTSGALGSTPSTRIKTSATALRTGMAALGHTQVVVTAVKPLTGTPVGSFRVITSEEVDEVIRTLRGRVKSRKASYV